MSVASGEAVHPCLSCGACCASYRASFYWGECVSAGGTVPDALTVQIAPFRVAMQGTDTSPPRCVALDGVIGQAVRCSIHPQRASVCREYPASYEDGTPHDRCDAARARFGLPALTPDDWTAFHGPAPRAA